MKTNYYKPTLNRILPISIISLSLFIALTTTVTNANTNLFTEESQKLHKLWENGATKFTNHSKDQLLKMINKFHPVSKNDQAHLHFFSFLSSDNKKQSEGVLGLDLPLNFNWREARQGCMVPSLDQGECGSCYAYTTAAMLAEKLCIQNNHTQAQLSKVLRSQSAFFALTGVHASPAREMRLKQKLLYINQNFDFAFSLLNYIKMRPRNYESTRVSDESRFDDQPAPQDDDMIRVHYLKHHPLYEFRNLEEFHVDSYRHWLHARADYWNTESYPAQISPWEMGSKWHNAFYLIFPFFAFYCIGNAYNVKDNIVGVWSQESI